MAMLSGTAEFVAVRTGVQPEDRLEPETLLDEPSIRQVSYDEARQEQRLTFRGVLLEGRKSNLEAQLPKPLPPSPHVPSAVLNTLLDDVMAQAREFFDKYLLKETAKGPPCTGFLESADFDLLFAAAPVGLDEGQQQELVRQRRTRLAQAFLPFLQQRLIRQFVVQSLAPRLNAEPALMESLLTDEGLLTVVGPEGENEPLLKAFTATSESGLDAAFFSSVDCSGASMAPNGLVISEADTGLRDEDGERIVPHGAQSVRIQGYIEVPMPGAYRFFVALEKKDAWAELRFDHLPQPLLVGFATKNEDEIDEYLELRSGALYGFTLDLGKLGGGDARLQVLGESLPKDGLGRLTTHPRSAMERGERAYVLLGKAIQVVQTFSLNEREVRFLREPVGGLEGVDLARLPVRDEGVAAGGSTSLFGQFIRLARYVQLRKDLTGGSDALIDVFQSDDPPEVYARIANLARRDQETVREMAEALFTTPVFDNEGPLQRLWEALRVIEGLGVPAERVVAWTRIVDPAATSEQRFAIARDLKDAIRARFEPEAWQRVARPIFDTLRKHQRDALVAYVMHKDGFARMEQLYEHFLIDPGMEPVVQTSRIRLAIGSVQLFIQRCLLNLERKVHPSAIVNARQWEWMKRYRIWEANRKIFLYPENWLEPEFRDDKTSLFCEMEAALLQGDISRDLAEDVFLQYLRRLEELARLDVVAMHLEEKVDPTMNTLHVIGRTHNRPHKHFYRRYAHGAWTPWEPLTAEIEGDHLAPVVWRDRLYLFWVTFLDKPDDSARTGTGTATQSMSEAKLPDLVKDLKEVGGKKMLDVQLHWSEYAQGAWSTPQQGDYIPVTRSIYIFEHFLVLPLRVPVDFDRKSVLIHVSKEPYEDGQERGVYVHLGDPINQSFYLAGRNSAPESAAYAPPSANPYGPKAVQATAFTGSGALKVTFAQSITTEGGGAPVPLIETPTILGQGRRFSLLPCDNDITLGAPEVGSIDADDPEDVAEAIARGLPEIASLIKPVFYQDNAHALFIEPNVEERTLEDWEGWVTPAPQPEEEWERPDWWKDLLVMPEVPATKVPIPDPGDPVWNEPLDPGCRFEVRPGRDWLINPATVLEFDGELIGRTGRTGLAPLTSTDALGAIAEGGNPVSIVSGSGVAADRAVIVPAGSTLEGAGLMQPAGGLTIIGKGGFVSAQAQNLATLQRSGFSVKDLDVGRVGVRAREGRS